jgi:Xaa-Pro aminopeptidase
LLAHDTYLVSWDAGLAAIRPGVLYLEASHAAGKALESRFATMPAWLKGPAEEFAKSLATGSPGHFLGMSLHIHDDCTSPLAPGQVVAYESACKIPDRGWRFTAEDVVLVTSSGHEALSGDLPRTASGIEQMTRPATPRP